MIGVHEGNRFANTEQKKTVGFEDKEYCVDDVQRQKIFSQALTENLYQELHERKFETIWRVRN